LLRFLLLPSPPSSSSSSLAHHYQLLLESNAQACTSYLEIMSYTLASSSHLSPHWQTRASFLHRRPQTCCAASCKAARENQAPPRAHDGCGALFLLVQLAAQIQRVAAFNTVDFALAGWRRDGSSAAGLWRLHSPLHASFVPDSTIIHPVTTHQSSRALRIEF
jgi:hypothetical protein